MKNTPRPIFFNCSKFTLFLLVAFIVSFLTFFFSSSFNSIIDPDLGNPEIHVYPLARIPKASAKSIDRLARITANLQYYKNKDNLDKTPKPINHERFLTWGPWEAGLNNRRMTFEIHYVLAYLLNRTLVLPRLENLQHFQKKLNWEYLFEEQDLRSGIPILTADEWDAYPNKENIIKDTLEVPWTIWKGFVPAFIYPKKIENNKEEISAKFEKWYANRASNRSGNLYDQYSLPRFMDAKRIDFPPNRLLNHWYNFIYIRSDSPPGIPKFTDASRLIRDHLHFPNKVGVYTAKIVAMLPDSFSTMHYRRGDLQYKESRGVTPEMVFNNTYDYYQDNETIYVSTDEAPNEFDSKFVPVFSKRYHIVTLRKFSKHVIDYDPVFIPMMEMQICSQGRAFVGTRFSTFSAYITRLRGYSKNVEKKKENRDNLLFTTIVKDENWLHQNLDWTIEQPDAWKDIKRK